MWGETGHLYHVTAAGTVSPRAITHPTYQPCLAAKEIHLDKAASNPDNKPLKCQAAQRRASIATAGLPFSFCSFAGLSPLTWQSHRPAESARGKGLCAWTHIVLLAKWNFSLFFQVLVLQASQLGQAKSIFWGPSADTCMKKMLCRERRQGAGAGPWPEMLSAKRLSFLL